MLYQMDNFKIYLHIECFCKWKSYVFHYLKEMHLFLLHLYLNIILPRGLYISEHNKNTVEILSS